MIVGVISISLQVFACFEGAFFCWVAMMIETCKQNTYWLYPEIEQLDVRDSKLFSDLRISEVEIWHFPWYSSNLGTFMMTTS